MQQHETNGWRTFWLLVGTLVLAAAGLCVVFRLERQLVRLCRTVGGRLRLRSSRFETEL